MVKLIKIRFIKDTWLGKGVHVLLKITSKGTSPSCNGLQASHAEQLLRSCEFNPYEVPNIYPYQPFKSAK